LQFLYQSSIAMTSRSSNLRPLIVGEVLFDCFPDHRVLGGAPFNVAWNLKGLGLNPLVITAVGDDDLGREVQQQMSAWELDASGLQVHPDVPTGRVDIQLTDGQAQYQFWDNVAFDRIGWPESALSGSQFGLLYHGSLAMRQPTSRETIIKLRQELDCPCFIDVNVRLPHFSVSTIMPLLEKVDHLKLNEDELRLLSRHLGAPDEGCDWQSLRKLTERLQTELEIKNCWLTVGQHGAAWFGPQGQYFQADAPRVKGLQDTVGAGDALAAVIIHGILTGVSPENSLARATQFAGRVCGLRGALTEDRQFYRFDDNLLNDD
jgi:fructokinase